MNTMQGFNVKGKMRNGKWLNEYLEKIKCFITRKYKDIYMKKIP